MEEAKPLIDDTTTKLISSEDGVECDKDTQYKVNAWTETIELIKLAIPIVATMALEFLPGNVSVAIVGHIDSPLRKEYVDAAALSSVLLSLTGFSVGFGLITAMDTLCSQTVGAGKLYNLGLYFQSGLIVLGFMYIPCLLLNFYAEGILLLLGQDPTVAALSGTSIAAWKKLMTTSGIYSKISVLSMPGLFLYELVKRVLQAQNVVNPMAYIAVVSNSLYIALAYYLCFYTEYGFLGAAVARVISNTILPLFACAYLSWNPLYKDWWPADHSFSAQWKAAFEHVPEFFALGLPGMFMMLMDSMAFEVCSLMVGWLPNPILNMSVNSVLMSIGSQVYSLFLGLNVAATVRLGNALGANEPNRARMISTVSLGVTFAVGLVVSLVFLIARDAMPRLFINDPDAIAATQHVLAIFAVYEMIDGMNCSTQSILKGMGKQSVGAWVNAAAYYIFGIPLGAWLAFYFKFGIEGLWFGLTGGLFLAFCVFVWFICRVSWKQMAIEAIARTST
ncbi:unnamed protein product [Aphanomyces euteiches]